jgi:hypothetical protein
MNDETGCVTLLNKNPSYDPKLIIAHILQCDRYVLNIETAKSKNLQC